MSFLDTLFSTNEPRIGLEQRGFLQQRRQGGYKDRYLSQINRAKVISENDALNLGYLVGSYLGRDIDINDPSSEDQNTQVWLSALEINVKVLERRKSKLQKGTAEYNEFMYQNTPDVQTFLQYLADLINVNLNDVALQKAYARPLVRYEYKINNRVFTGKENFSNFAQEFGINTPELVKIYKSEIQRVYIPTYLSYSAIGISLIVALNAFRKRG